MIKLQLKALEHPNPSSVDVEDRRVFAITIIWLEDQKIRLYKIEDRKGLRQVENIRSWERAYEQYKKDLGVPKLNSSQEEMSWLLSYAVRLEGLEGVIKEEIDGVASGEKSRASKLTSVLADTHKTYSSVRNRQVPAKNSNRYPITPMRGEPGGLDDPLRRGLSGAGVRWYLRFLKTGMHPEEARKKVLERKTKAAELHSKETPEKRGNHHITPPPREDTKRRKTSEAETKSAQLEKTTPIPATSSINRVAVLSKDYPQTILTPGQLNALEDAIVEEMITGWEVKLQFECIHFKPGMILLDCANVQTADWLKLVTPTLKKWEGAELMTCSEDDIPQTHSITIFLPKSVGEAFKTSLAFINAQNEGLNTNVWKIIRSREEGDGHVLAIGIDDQSATVIKSMDHEMHYKFGKIPVHGLRKSTEQAKVVSGNAQPGRIPESEQSDKP